MRSRSCTGINSLSLVRCACVRPTPQAYPAQNSTFNVTHSTLHVLKGEFKKGREVCAKILLGAAKWEALWEPLPFFQMHKHYLQVTMCASNEEDFKKWEGWVHSRLRLLVQAVETCSGGALVAHPYPRRWGQRPGSN